MHGMRVSVHIDPSSTDGNSLTVNRRIIALALPTFGQLIAEPTFVLIDTAIVGHIGDTALAGLSIGSTIILTAVGLCVFLAYSTTAQGHICSVRGTAAKACRPASTDFGWLWASASC